MSYAMLERKLAAGECVYLDGGSGSELQRLGAPMHPSIFGAMATMTNPDILQRVHEDYIRAGCDIITTNSFYLHSGYSGYYRPVPTYDAGARQATLDPAPAFKIVVICDVRASGNSGMRA